MKKKLTVLVVLLIAVVTFTQAQSKKDIEDALAKCNTTKDSIQTRLSGISAEFDSISKACIAYDTMYNAIKEKVFLKDFDPASMSELIDSLRKENTYITTALNDSLAVLNQQNADLTEIIKGNAEEPVDKTAVVNDLKQLKELFDEKILTQEEFDAKKKVLVDKL